MGTPAANPLTIGFDYNIAGHAAGAMGELSGRGRIWRQERSGTCSSVGCSGLEQYHGTDTFLTEALTLEAKKLIR